MRKILFLLVVITTIECKGQDWLSDQSKTGYRYDASLQGNAGATSGFFQAPNYPSGNASNYPHNNPTWWHLLDVRHSNPNNNYAMQFAGEFWGTDLYFRKTAGDPATPWSKVLLQTNGVVDVKAQSTFSRDGMSACCTGNFSFAIAENTGGTGKKASISFHNAGYDEGMMELSRDAGFRSIKFYDNQGLGLGIDVRGNARIAGDITTKKIHVTQQGWPDYVFKNTYNLRSLQDVETYIQKNKHLPDMPSATDVAKNGIDLGENQALLLKKIEELTLYVIELQKQVNKMKSK